MKDGFKAKPTQEQLVLNHLQNIGGLTAFEAYDIYGITQLGARIWALRQNGNNILKIWHSKETKGKKIRFCEYKLVGGK